MHKLRFVRSDIHLGWAGCLAGFTRQAVFERIGYIGVLPGIFENFATSQLVQESGSSTSRVSFFCTGLIAWAHSATVGTTFTHTNASLCCSAYSRGVFDKLQGTLDNGGVVVRPVT